MKKRSLWIGALLVLLGCNSSNKSGNVAPPASEPPPAAEVSQGLEGPGTFSRSLTKQDFPQGVDVSDLIWIDQVNGSISKDEAVQQYLCYLRADDSCLNPKYQQEADPKIEAMRWDNNRLFALLQNSLTDLEVSETNKQTIRSLFGIAQTTSTISKGLNDGRQIEEDVGDGLTKIQWSETTHPDSWTLCRKAITPTNVHFDICYHNLSLKEYPEANDLTKKIKSVLEKDAPYEKLKNFFNIDLPLPDDRHSFKINLSEYRVSYASPVATSSTKAFPPDISLSLPRLRILWEAKYPRGTRQWNIDEMLQGLLSHALTHAFETTFLRAKLAPGTLPFRTDLTPRDPYREALADWGEDFAFPKNDLEQVHLDLLLDGPNSKRSLLTYIDDTQDSGESSSYPSYIWFYYMSHRYSPQTIKEYLERIRSGEGSKEIMAKWAAKENSLLGFAASLLNLGINQPDQGILDFQASSDEHKEFSPFFLNKSITTASLPGEAGTQKYEYQFAPVSPAGWSYFVLVTNDGPQHNGTLPYYKVLIEAPPTAQLGVVALKTDPTDRTKIILSKFQLLRPNQEELLEYEDPNMRPDALVFIATNPTLEKWPQATKLTIGGKPTKTEVDIMGHVESNLDNTPGVSGKLTADYTGTLDYYVGEINSRGTRVEDFGRQLRIRTACPTYSKERDEDKWYFKSGSATVAVDGVLGDCHTTGSKTFNLGQDVASADLGFSNGDSGTFTWGSYLDTYGKNPMPTTTACRINNQTVTTAEEKSSNLSPSITGLFKMGAKELKKGDDQDSNRVKITFKTALTDYSDIKDPPPLFGEVGGQPDQFIPYWLDNININTQYPSCDQAAQ